MHVLRVSTKQLTLFFGRRTTVDMEAGGFPWEVPLLLHNCSGTCPTSIASCDRWCIRCLVVFAIIALDTLRVTQGMYKSSQLPKRLNIQRSSLPKTLLGGTSKALSQHAVITAPCCQTLLERNEQSVKSACRCNAPCCQTRFE